MMTVVSVWQYLRHGRSARQPGEALGGTASEHTHHMLMPARARLKAASCVGVRGMGLFWKSEL